MPRHATIHLFSSPPSTIGKVKLIASIATDASAILFMICCLFETANPKGCTKELIDFIGLKFVIPNIIPPQFFLLRFVSINSKC
ncbi:MAG: hypothetical protein ACRDDW_06810 [Candidatus Rhabdochlamydia sp.]